MVLTIPDHEMCDGRLGFGRRVDDAADGAVGHYVADTMFAAVVYPARNEWQVVGLVLGAWSRRGRAAVLKCAGQICVENGQTLEDGCWVGTWQAIRVSDPLSRDGQSLLRH